MSSNFHLPPSLHAADQLGLCADELVRFASLGSAKHGEATLSPEAVQLLVLNKLEDGSASELRALADWLEQTAQKAPKMTIILAGAPLSALREELVAWARANLHAHVLIEFQVNPDIAGGMMVRTTNQLHDFSFRTALLEGASEFSKVLGRA